jgi:hypothetical protein
MRYVTRYRISRESQALFAMFGYAKRVLLKGEKTKPFLLAEPGVSAIG